MWSVLSLLAVGAKWLIGLFRPKHERLLGRLEAEKEQREKADETQERMDAVRRRNPDEQHDRMRDGDW